MNSKNFVKQLQKNKKERKYFLNSDCFNQKYTIYLFNKQNISILIINIFQFWDTCDQSE